MRGPRPRCVSRTAMPSALMPRAKRRERLRRPWLKKQGAISRVETIKSKESSANDYLYGVYVYIYIYVCACVYVYIF